MRNDRSPAVVADDERFEPRPDRICPIGHVVDDLGEQVGREGLTQHGHPPEQLAVGNGEAVDAGDDDVLDGIGEGADGIPVLHRRHEFPHEEGIAAGSIDEQLHFPRRQGGFVGRRQRELGRFPLG